MIPATALALSSTGYHVIIFRSDCCQVPVVPCVRMDARANVLDRPPVGGARADATSRFLERSAVAQATFLAALADAGNALVDDSPELSRLAASHARSTRRLLDAHRAIVRLRADAGARVGGLSGDHLPPSAGPRRVLWQAPVRLPDSAGEAEGADAERELRELLDAWWARERGCAQVLQGARSQPGLVHRPVPECWPPPVTARLGDRLVGVEHAIEGDARFEQFWSSGWHGRRASATVHGSLTLVHLAFALALAIALFALLASRG